MTTLDVPGATLYHEARGTGPLLLLIPGGNGDAAPFAPLTRELADRFTVIAYDRRGFSRSSLTNGVPADRLVADVADAVALIDAVGGSATTAHVLGSSSGAIVALELLIRHPSRLGMVVAHEPPLTSVLPDRAEWEEFFADLYATCHRDGVDAAMAIFGRRMGLGDGALPDASSMPPPVQEMIERLRVNQEFWLEHEVQQYPAIDLDLDALVTHADQLVLAGGAESRDFMPYQPNLVLAKRLGLSVVDMPGNHIGYTMSPAPFAAQLATLLARTVTTG